MSEAKPNIIVIIADALRADHLGCYGYSRKTSPNIDKFAEQAVLFELAFSAAPVTESSIPSILSGLLPSLHGMGVDGNRLKLKEQVVTIPQVLQRQGYTTVGFNTNPLVAGMYGYRRGFCERYEIFPQCGGIRQNATLSIGTEPTTRRFPLSLAPHKVCSRGVNEEVFNWLKLCRKEPFFMWIHYMDTHSRYIPQQPYFSNYAADASVEGVTKFLQQYDSIFARLHQNNPMAEFEKKLIVDSYDSGINYFDENFGSLASLLKEEGIFDNSLIILTADHGEEFWEHEYWGHLMRMYDYNLRVPLLLSCPELIHSPKKITKQVRNIDIFPTVAESLGIDGLRFSGASLLPYVKDEKAAVELPVISEGGGLKRLTKDEFIDRVFAIRTPQWKLIKNITKGELELYNLREDPSERENLAQCSGVRSVIDELNGQLSSSLKGEQNSDLQVCAPVMSEQITARLAALGYD